jgi:hypothetical protein
VRKRSRFHSIGAIPVVIGYTYHMISVPRFCFMLAALLMLAACATPLSIASAPTPVGAATPTLTARRQAIEAAPSDRVELTAGHYQLLMLYSPL